MPTEDQSPGSREPQDAYLWEVAGKPVSARLDFSVLDNLLQEVMRGFGLMPRRSVEVGGLLLGSVEERGPDRWLVSVTDMEPVPCRHTRGMGWLLSDQELIRFEEILARWHPGEGKRTFAVGFFRSHTREGLGLSQEDLELYRKYFPDPWAVALLVKPFATRASVGSFFIREGAQLRSEAGYQEFPFRRRELGGDPPEMEADGMAAAPPPEAPRGPVWGAQQDGGRNTMTAAIPEVETSDQLRFGLSTATAAPSGKKTKSGWVWIPLSFIFLLFGVLLGAYIAMNVKLNVPLMNRADAYALDLAVSRSGGSSLHVKWNRGATAVQNSSRGLLHIQDGDHQKTVELDLLQLQSGSVLYRRASGQVRFRLEVFPRDRVSVSESLDYKEP